MKGEERVPCVEVRDLVKRFSGIPAVNHIDLEVKQGEVFSLLGPSGCGKTTTLRIIAGLEKADEGEVLIEGTVVNEVPPYRRDCNLVFQNLALFPHMTIGQNIAYGLERKRVPKDKIRESVGEILDFMRLKEAENRYPTQLSGGQQQRIALARSLVLKPKILLLDEPLASLDRKLRKDMQAELKRIQQDVGITFFYVTHDQRVALAISDTIAVMRDGRLEQVGSPEEIYDTPATRFVADFIGASNIFPGRVIGRSGEEIQLESESGLRIIAIAHEASKGEDITGICIHPERIKVSVAGTGVKADNQFEGQIMGMVYQGDFVEMRVRLSGTKTDETITAHLNARVFRENRLTVGKEVIAHWARESSSLLHG